MACQYPSYSFPRFYCDLMPLHPVAQVSTCCSVLPGDPGLGCSILEECCYFHLMRIQLTLADAFGATQWHPLQFACGNRGEHGPGNVLHFHEGTIGKLQEGKLDREAQAIRSSSPSIDEFPLFLGKRVIAGNISFREVKGNLCQRVTL